MKKGGENLFVIFQNQAWFEKGENNVRSGEEGLLITYPTGSCKYPEISFPFLWEGSGSASDQPSTPLPASQADTCP